MGGPGSGKSASLYGWRGESRGWSKGGSQVRGRGRVTATTFQEQLLREEEEEEHIMESHKKEQANNPNLTQFPTRKMLSLMRKRDV